MRLEFHWSATMSIPSSRWEAPRAPGVAEASEADPYLLQVRSGLVRLVKDDDSDIFWLFEEHGGQRKSVHAGIMWHFIWGFPGLGSAGMPRSPLVQFGCDLGNHHLLWDAKRAFRLLHHKSTVGNPKWINHSIAHIEMRHNIRMWYQPKHMIWSWAKV